jgi:hypothetical protein
MTPHDFDLTQPSLIFQLANTPLFLARKLHADPEVRAIADNCSTEEILAALKTSISAESTTAVEAVRPYVLLVALWFKPDIDGLQEAVGMSAPDLNWYTYIGNALMISFSPVQTQSIRTPGRLHFSSVTDINLSPVQTQSIQTPGRLHSPSVTESSQASTNQIIIVP